MMATLPPVDERVDFSRLKELNDELLRQYDSVVLQNSNPETQKGTADFYNGWSKVYDIINPIDRFTGPIAQSPQFLAGMRKGYLDLFTYTADSQQWITRQQGIERHIVKVMGDEAFEDAISSKMLVSSLGVRTRLQIAHITETAALREAYELLRQQIISRQEPSDNLEQLTQSL
jgi:hypothetical protein